jgi:hypothetical protein
MKRLAALAACLLMLPGLAAAQALRATYEVHAAGMVVMEIEARFDLSPQDYQLETRVRTRGIAALFASGEQTTRVRGGWSGTTPLPASYVSEGVWRGRARRTALDWEGGSVRVVALVPPNEEERETVSDELRSGTVDALSALAGLSRQVGTEQGCALSAPVFDGRQRSDFTAGNGRREVILPWRDAWRGEALRCEVEGVQVAGFRFDGQWRENATPRRAVAWIAPPYAGAPPVPVRVDMPSRWFGTATAVLLRAEPVDRLQARPAERRADLAR